MNEDQRLSMLDRRAADATSALDDAVQQVPVPKPDLGAPRRSVRRFFPLAVAAGLTVLVLVGAALVFDDDEQSTIADQSQGITRLALPDPESLGYRIVGAFDGSSRDGSAAGLDVPMTFYAPTDAEDRWQTTIVGYSFPTDGTTLGGDPVSLAGPGAAGGPEATLVQSESTVTVAWVEEDRTRHLSSVDLSAGELVALARQAVALDVPDGAPLPEHDIIHVAAFGDLTPIISLGPNAVPADAAGVAYEGDLGDFVLATMAGSRDRWMASHALAADIDEITVRGRPAVLADFGNEIQEISWLEDDGTLVRVDAYGGEIPVDVLEELEPISDADLADLVHEHGEGVEVVEHHLDAVGEEIGAEETPTTRDERTPLAEVSLGEEGFTIRATLLQAPDGSIALETISEGAAGGNGTGQGLVDTSTNVVVRAVAAPGGGGAEGELIAGIIGPSGGMVDFVDPSTGETFDPVGTSGPSHATIPGSDHVLFLGTIAPEHRGRDITVVTTTPAGEEIRLSAPAQP